MSVITERFIGKIKNFDYRQLGIDPVQRNENRKFDYSVVFP